MLFIFFTNKVVSIHLKILKI